MRKDNTNPSSLTSVRTLAGLLFRGGWPSILCILIIELLLSYATPASVSLHDSWLLRGFVEVMQQIAPFIGKINSSVSPYPDMVRLYLAVTLFFLLPKTAIFYYWMRKSNSNSGQLIISPLTDTHSQSVEHFIVEPIREEGGGEEERSWLSRIIWSILIFAFTAGMLWANLCNGSIDSTNTEIRNSFHNIGTGELLMWYQWSVKQMTFLAFLLSISVAAGQDYYIYLKQKMYSDFKD